MLCQESSENVFHNDWASGSFLKCQMMIKRGSTYKSNFNSPFNSSCTPKVHLELYKGYTQHQNITTVGPEET